MLKPKKIWHVGAWNRNYGDWVILDSMHHHLQHTANQRDLCIDWLNIDAQNTYFSPELIDKLNREADMLIIGGGGLIFHRPEDNSVSGWQWNIKQADIESIQVPLIVYGIGYNRFPYDDTEWSDNLKHHLFTTRHEADLFSVRNHGTKRWLDGECSVRRDIRVIMDAAAFAPKTDIKISERNPNKPLIGINIAGDRPYHRYADERRYYEFTDPILDAAESLDVQIINIPHLMKLDRGHDEEFNPMLPKYIYPPCQAHASHLVGIYAQCDLVLGMRGHACIIPYGQNVPFIALGDHQKNQFFLEEVGRTGNSLDTNAIENMTTDDIAGMIRNTINNKEAIRRHLSYTHKRHKQNFDKWNEQVIECLR